MGDELHSLGDERLLGKKDLRGKGTVLGVSADVALQPFHNGINAHKAHTVIALFGAGKASGNLFQLTCSGEVGKGNIQLGILHVHIHTDQPFIRGQRQTGLDGIVKEIADDAAKIQLRQAELYGNMGIGNDLNPP